MARLPSAPAPRTFAIAGWIVTAKDVIQASTDAEEKDRAIGFQRRAEAAATLIHDSIVRAANLAMAADARVTPKHQADLARNVAAKADALIRAIHGDSAPTPGGTPTPLALMLGHVTAAAPPLRAQASAVAQVMQGSVWWEQAVHARTEQDLPRGDTPTSMTAAEAADFAARLAPPTPEQEAQGRAEAAVFAAMTMLPAALEILVALADAAERAAESAVARDHRDKRKRGGRRTDPFIGTVMRGIVSAYRRMFDAWPEGKPDKVPTGRPDARTWTRAVLQAAHANLTSGTIRGDSAFVAERIGRITALTEVSLGDDLNAAVFAEKQAGR